MTVNDILLWEQKSFESPILWEASSPSKPTKLENFNFKECCTSGCFHGRGWGVLLRDAARQVLEANMEAVATEVVPWGNPALHCFLKVDSGL